MTDPADTANSGLVARFLRVILQSLEDDKAEQIVTIDLVGKTSIADHMVIASGRSSRQVAAMAEHLARRLKDAGAGAARLEGLPYADWVLIDAKDIVVHLFRPEVRCFYKLEKMWGADTLVEPPSELTMEEEEGAALDATPLDPGDEA